MRKLVLLVGLVALSIGAFAQSKGEMYVLTTGHVSFGNVKEQSFNNNGMVTNTTKQPLTTYLRFDAGFGYFVANNFRLELGLGAYYEKHPREQWSGNTWLSNTYRGFCVCPSLSYYVRLAERFYYTPEIGVNFIFGKYSYDESYNKTWNCPYRGFSLYANLLAFSYRVGPHFALFVALGELDYGQRSYYDEGKVFYSGNTTAIYLNSALVSAHFYF